MDEVFLKSHLKLSLLVGLGLDSPSNQVVSSSLNDERRGAIA